ncbi:MAG TPA: GNAT family N-acetyltransferase [Thermohalobaculum sp.]|nr:GNAT family N-acetyltransferase [Thermohalobaculum sp.]
MAPTRIRPLSMDDLILETGRLILRPLTTADIDLTRALLTDPEVMRHVGDPTPKDQLAAKTRERTRRAAGGRIGVWAVTDRATGEKLGTAILLPLPVDQEKRAWSRMDERAYPDGEIEVGYLLRPPAWGRGIATEACGRLLRFAFEATALDEIVAVTDPDNIASQRVLMKAGLRSEGPRRAYDQTVAGFRITRADWRAGPGKLTV